MSRGSQVKDGWVIGKGQVCHYRGSVPRVVSGQGLGVGAREVEGHPLKQCFLSTAQLVHFIIWIFFSIFFSILHLFLIIFSRKSYS